MNECGDSVAGGCDAGRPDCEKPLDRVAPDLDWVSIDIYEGFAPGSNGSAEAAEAQHWAHKQLYPRMAPHQRLVTVPGVFGASAMNRPVFICCSRIF